MGNCSFFGRGTMKTLRLQFGLRSLMLFPVLVAAFFGGWMTHEHAIRQEYRREETAARQLYKNLRDEMDRDRAVEGARLRETIDRLEHRQRMDSLRARLNDPLKTRTFPEGRFK